MDPKLRILTCILAEKMKENREYAEKLKLTDLSEFRKDRNQMLCK